LYGGPAGASIIFYKEQTNERKNEPRRVTIYEREGMGEKAFRHLLPADVIDRIIMIDGEINDYVASDNRGSAALPAVPRPEKDISVYINSPGGSVTAGLAIFDTMQHIKPDIQTICVGQAASMGAVLLAGGTKGKRMALPSSRIMIHQPWGGAQGQARDIAIRAKEIVRLKKMLTQILANARARAYDEMAKDMERDFFLSSQEGCSEYGIIDKVLTRDENGKE
jgi:ATP-dependent Clp protease protease subunit